MTTLRNKVMEAWSLLDEAAREVSINELHARHQEQRHLAEHGTSPATRAYAAMKADSFAKARDILRAAAEPEAKDGYPMGAGEVDRLALLGGDYPKAVRVPSTETLAVYNGDYKDGKEPVGYVTITRAFTPVEEPGECKNPECPIGCPESHCFTRCPVCETNTVGPDGCCTVCDWGCANEVAP